MKRLLALTLSVLLAIGLVLPVMAMEDDSETYTEDDSEIEAIVPLPRFMSITGTIVDVLDNEVVIERINDDGKFRVGITDNTVIVDAATGLMTTIADRDNDNIKAYVPTFWGMSEPPFAAAFVIATNVEGLNAPNMYVIEAVAFSDDDTVKITVNDGSLIITLNRETPLSHTGLTREAMTLEKIQVGDTMLFWYHMVALSHPAQTTAIRAIWLSAAGYQDAVTLPAEISDEVPNDYVPVTTLPAVTGQFTPPAAGNVTAVTPIYVGPIPGTGIIRDGIEFFPVRAIAEKMGYTIHWNAELGRAELNVPGTARMVNIYPGEARADLNRAFVNLSAATFIEDGVMYAPQDFFELIG